MGCGYSNRVHPREDSGSGGQPKASALETTARRETEAEPALLKRLRELVALVHGLGDLEALSSDASTLLSKDSMTWLKTPGASPGLVASLATMATQLADAILLPVVGRVEKELGSQDGAVNWDTVDVPGVITILESASRDAYGKEGLSHVGKVLKSCAEVLLEINSRGFQTTYVRSADALASMAGLIFFKRVVLESHATLEQRVAQISQLQLKIGLSSSSNDTFGLFKLLAISLSPGTRAMLAGLHQSAMSGGDLKLKVKVRRSAAFWDGQQQAANLNLPPKSSESPSHIPMSYKIFPSFVDEWTMDDKEFSEEASVEAGEGHGPRKEFFALAAANMTGQSKSDQGKPTSQKKDLFTHNRSAGYFWYNTMLQQSATLTDAYQFSGWLMGQSLLNHAPLGIPLPLAMMRHLISGVDGFEPSLEDLQAFDPDAARGIRNASQLSKDELRSLMEVEGLPLSTSHEQYARHAVKTLLVEDVKWQARALRDGFLTAISVKVLSGWCLDYPEALASVILGTDGDDRDSKPLVIQNLFRVVLDEELQSHKGLDFNLGDLLWDIVDAWPRDRQVQFLKFVTGSSRLPIPKSELLKVECPFVAFGLDEQKAMLGMLPQAHTCDNLLELPNYLAALMQVRGHKSASGLPPGDAAQLKTECIKIIQDRLTLAIGNYSGYDLD